MSKIKSYIYKWLFNRAVNKYGYYNCYMFYRCQACRKILLARDILKGSCVCNASMMRVAVLSTFEKLRYQVPFSPAIIREIGEDMIKVGSN